jgi:ATP-dependent Lon protease
MTQKAPMTGLAWTALGGKTLVVEARGRVPASNVSWSEDGLPSGNLT